MSYAILSIITDPEHAEVVKKMREELDANLGNEPLRLSEKHKIPYCEAVSALKSRISFGSKLFIPKRGGENFPATKMVLHVSINFINIQ